jgi:hypothetical protein
MKKQAEVLAAAASTLSVESSSLSPSSLSDKIAAATEGLSYNCFDHLHDVGNRQKQNALTICDYIFSLKSEINPSDNYRKGIIMMLCSLSAFFNNNAKSFI